MSVGKDGRQAPEETHFRFLLFRQSQLVPITTREVFFKTQAHITRHIRQMTALLPLRLGHVRF